MLAGKKILISGGTGSFGNAVVERYLHSDLLEIRVFSRDEKKQDDMRKQYADDKLKFFIGDVRQRESLKRAMDGVDLVFHAAALKQVPSCEFHPSEAIRTNVLGTENLIDCAIEAGVSHVICLSTDKAVYPINVMGMSKAIMEKIALSRAQESHRTIICCTRYGNVIGSRGSVVPLFCDQIQKGLPLSVTNPSMTRFMMLLEEAVDLVTYAFEHAQGGDIFVPKVPAASIQTLVDAVRMHFGSPHHEVLRIGTRHGEKLYETLLSKEEMIVAEDLGRFYRIPPDLRELNYEKYIDQGNDRMPQAVEFNSHNADQLNPKQLLALLEGYFASEEQ